MSILSTSIGYDMSDDKINDLNEYKKKKEDAKMQEAAINNVANLLQEEAD